MFEKENKFYENNKDNLRKHYLGKEVVIVEDRVMAAYDDVGTAIRETVKTRLLGSFCVKNVPESPEEKVIRIPTFLVSLCRNSLALPKR
jgi:hypothetical protein